MAMSEEEQMAAMLAEMGMDSLESLEETVAVQNPIPEGPVKRKTEEVSNVSQVEEKTEFVENVAAQVTDQVPEDKISQEVNNEVAESQIEQIRTVRSAVGTNRELTISSLVHLMGLPTGTQVGVIDTKLDLIAAKLTTLQSKLDRLQSQLDLVTTNSPMERIEFQLTEVRSIMKKFFPNAFNSTSNSDNSQTAIQSKPQMLSNKSKSSNPVVTEAPKKETAVHVDVPEAQKAEEEEPLTDADYQALEAMKLREKNQTK